MSHQIPTNATDFHREGFARFDNLLHAEEWQQLSTIYDELFVDPTSHPHFRQLGGTENGMQLMPQILAPHKARPELLSSPYAQRIATLARELLGPTARLQTSHMILKPAGSPRDTPWHQDQSYHSPDYNYRNINFWLPLDGADIDDGCMWYVPRSHSGVIVPHQNVGGDATATAATEQAYWHANGVAVPLRKGSVSAHLSYCLHYAGPNRSTRPRRAWILVYGCEPVPREQPRCLPWQAERAC